MKHKYVKAVKDIVCNFNGSETTEQSLLLYSSDGREEDCHPAALGLIIASAKLKLLSLNSKIS